jgi:hypothetical protein
MGVYTGVDVGRFGGCYVVDRPLRDIDPAERRRNERCRRMEARRQRPPRDRSQCLKYRPARRHAFTGSYRRQRYRAGFCGQLFSCEVEAENTGRPAGSIS